MRNDQLNLNNHKLNSQEKEKNFEISTTGYGLQSVAEPDGTNKLEKKETNLSSYSGL